ncbi:MAG: DUF3875 domain-containing protein, partial [Algicola sp.]|nr:DUF3875 domain-containing protein [Algicola sp.]
MSKLNFNSYHPILDIQNHVVFGSNGNVVLCYQVELPEIYSLSETDFEALHGMWFQAFKSLPVGTVIHKQDMYQKKGYDARNLPRDTILAKATHDYFVGRELLDHQSYLFFVLPLDKALNATKYVNPFRKVEKGMHRKLDVQVAEFVTAVNDAISYINNTRSASLVPMIPESILAYTHEYYNGFNMDFDTDIQFGKGPITIGDHFFDVMAINNEGCFGETVQSSVPNGKFSSDGFSFHKGFLDSLGLELGENHMINQILYLDDIHQWRRLLDKKIEELSKSSNFGSQNKVVHNKIEDILNKINGDETSRIVRGHVNVVFWHTEVGALKRIASNIKAALKELDIRPYHPNGEERTHYFLNSYPC